MTKNNEVIKNILARRNKKPPFKDGRKIIMLHPGGVMAGIQGCGALSALQEMGFTNAFDEIYTISAGFPNISYFLAGQSETSITVYYENLSAKKFINPLKIWNVENVDYLINIFQRSSKKLVFDKIAKHKTEIYVFLKNTDTGTIDCFHVPKLNRDEYFSLLRAAVSMPILSPESVEIEKNHYKDIYLDFEEQRLMLFDKIANSGVTDVLAIYNYSSDKKYTSKKYHTLEIFPKKDWLDSPYETDSNKLKRAAENMKKQTRLIFGLS